MPSYLFITLAYLPLLASHPKLADAVLEELFSHVVICRATLLRLRARHTYFSRLFQWLFFLARLFAERLKSM